MPALLGTELHPEDRRHALAAYVHRHTGDHPAEWAIRNGIDFHFATDAEWLANTTFWVRKDGRLDRRVKQCFTAIPR